MKTVKKIFENWKLKIVQDGREASRGSTLLLGILIVSIILASTFILGRVALRNIRQMRTVLVAEKVVFAGEAGLEQGLWAHVRDEDSYVGDCDNDTTYSKTLTTEESITSSNCRSYLKPSPSPLIVPKDSSLTIYLINPADPEGGANYRSVSFTLVKGNATVKLCEWDVIDCASGNGITWSHSSGTLDITNLRTDSKYIILIDAGTSSDYEVLASGLDGNNNSRGLPADYVTVEGKGDDSTFGNVRTLEMQVLP